MSVCPERDPRGNEPAVQEVSPAGFHPLAPVRAVVRIVLFLGWTLAFYAAIKCAGVLSVASPQLARRTKRALASMWIRNIYRILGTRVVVQGIPPAHPFFIVGNHVSWIDLFAGATIYKNVTMVVEDPIRKLPIVGTFICAFEPVFLKRSREDTARAVACLVEAIRNGRDIVLAPEDPYAGTRPGSTVRRFRAGLLESAVQTGTGVHFCSLVYRTPKGYPPPSQSILFGPSPFYRKPNGEIIESELQAHGSERSFFKHIMGVLGMPWHEATFRFGGQPIFAADRITLANNLHDAVQRIFTPLQ